MIFFKSSFQLHVQNEEIGKKASRMKKKQMNVSKNIVRNVSANGVLEIDTIWDNKISGKKWFLFHFQSVIFQPADDDLDEDGDQDGTEQPSTTGSSG